MRRFFNSLLALLLASVILLPVVMTALNSLMSRGEILKYFGFAFGIDGASSAKIHLIPDRLTFGGYYQVLLRQSDYLMKFWSSICLAAAIVVGQVVVGTMGGYAFAKFDFPLKKPLFALILLLMIMPLQVTLVPNYIVLNRLNLIGSYWSVILPGVFSAFGVFLMRQVMLTVPDDLSKAAKIDGAGQISVLLRVIAPSCKSGIASLTILTFIDAWSMVEQPLIFLKSAFQYPLSIFIMNVNTSQPGVAFALSVLAIFPVALLFFLFEGELLKGIEYSIIK